MAERGGPGRWSPAPRNRRLPARGRSFALPIEHFSAPCVRRMVRERGEAAPQGEKHPCPVRRRCCDGVRRLPRRPTGLRCSGQATCPVWAHASSRQDALHRFPQLPIRWERPSGSGWDIVHLPWLLPRVGKVAEGQERGAASNGKTALRPCAGSGDRMVPEEPASADPRAAHPTGRADAGPLWLLRHIGQLSSTTLVRQQGCEDLAKMAIAAGSGERAQLGPLQRTAQATSSAGTPDRPSLRCCERSSPVKNRTREICTSGTVRGEGGNILTYSDTLDEEERGKLLRLQEPRQRRPQAQDHSALRGDRRLCSRQPEA